MLSCFGNPSARYFGSDAGGVGGVSAGMILSYATAETT